MRRVPGTPLWLGHVGDARDARALHRAAIQAVVDLAANEPPVAAPREMACCRFPLVDAPGNPPWLLRAAVETIAGLLLADVATLVYCAHGLSRTPAVAAAALSRARGVRAEEALAVIASAGPADVSPGLWRELRGLLTSPPCATPALSPSRAAPPAP